MTKLAWRTRQEQPLQDFLLVLQKQPFDNRIHNGQNISIWSMILPGFHAYCTRHTSDGKILRLVHAMA